MPPKRSRQLFFHILFRDRISDGFLEVFLFILEYFGGAFWHIFGIKAESLFGEANGEHFCSYVLGKPVGPVGIAMAVKQAYKAL